MHKTQKITLNTRKTVDCHYFDFNFFFQLCFILCLPSLRNRNVRKVWLIQIFFIKILVSDTKSIYKSFKINEFFNFPASLIRHQILDETSSSFLNTKKLPLLYKNIRFTKLLKSFPLNELSSLFVFRFVWQSFNPIFIIR